MTRKGVSAAVAVSEINNIGVNEATNDSLGRKVVAALFSVVLASVIIGATGFSSGYAHNAAHDTRHVMVFPCH
ncbi:CbtB domain-containing protein [Kaarinaea lacus]